MTSNPNIKTSKPVVPQIYCYIAPGIPYLEGWSKIGYTEQNVEKRIKQQTHTAAVQWKIEWNKNAIYEGTGKPFTDLPFHAYLRKLGIEQDRAQDNEWFYISGKEAKLKFYDFRENHGVVEDQETASPYTLREEQEAAVQLTSAYYQTHAGGEFLWNAKPRFGKTLTTYDFAKRVGAERILIVTNRPAIANSWYDEYVKFLGTASGYLFVSEVTALKDKKREKELKYVVSREQFAAQSKYSKCIEFVSLQDMKGSLYFGGQYDKLKELTECEWDILVVDEAHEGVDTYKTDIAFNRIKRRFTLHLSGTPFKALANSKFADDAIFNWTYADEQEKKANWSEDNGAANPYAVMPKLHLYTYQMSEIVRQQVRQGVEINGQTEEYAFDLNEFFRVEKDRFVYEDSVVRFLDALTRQNKYPFSTPELRDELRHTLWLLNRVESAKALARKLKEHPVFKDYEVILAAGDGRMSDEDALISSYDKVKTAIRKCRQTITLSVGQLTTGITVPQWSAVLMLSNIKSPSLYMQAAFRAQNPCLYQDGTVFKRKTDAYVFDFDPARTLTIFEEFALNLSPCLAKGGGTAEERKASIRKLLNFFPVVGEDEQGELIELDPGAVLAIPRRIRAEEVVKRGFMSNFLFQNISNIFGAPKIATDIIGRFDALTEPAPIAAGSLPIDADGEINIGEDIIVGKAADLFGEKIYSNEEIQSEIFEFMDELQSSEAHTKVNQELKRLKSFAHEKINQVAEVGRDVYGADMPKTAQKNIVRNVEQKIGRRLETLQGNHALERNILEQERLQEQKNRFETGRDYEEIESEYAAKLAEERVKYQAEVAEVMQSILTEASQETVRVVETSKIECRKTEVENSVRDHLRGFTRTIPLFLMAYGDENTTLAGFDKIVPDAVFQEVTGITIEEFRFLRDGGDYEEEGEVKHYEGHLFDPIVFDDSVKRFLELKYKLADYFEETSTETIFDYIPPQKSNRVFTPKPIVEKMVDMLETENPGCFSDPNHTFIDLYMKSGLYIAEIVKRLYQNKRLTKLFPNREERLKHIFAKQVYGLAPTEIIYRIVLAYVLGFDTDCCIANHNLKLFDALPYAKEGTLADKLEEVYG